MSEPFIGEIRVVGFGFAPQGWAICNGQILSIAQNQALFSILGTTYGGNGQTTFALPNLQGRAPMNWGQGPGLTPRNVGESAGTAAVTLTTDQMPVHNHIPSGASGAGTVNNPAGNIWAASVQQDNHYSPTSDTTMNPSAIGTAGNSQPHNNIQPSLSLMFIIALVGIYPSRS